MTFNKSICIFMTWDINKSICLVVMKQILYMALWILASTCTGLRRPTLLFTLMLIGLTSLTLETPSLVTLSSLETFSFPHASSISQHCLSQVLWASIASWSIALLKPSCAIIFQSFTTLPNAFTCTGFHRPTLLFTLMSIGLVILTLRTPSLVTLSSLETISHGSSTSRCCLQIKC